MISLNFSCPQAINDLSKNKNGLFCTACDKSVKDLRGKSVQEIEELIKTSSQKICGIIEKDQIAKPHGRANRSRFQLAFLFVFFFGFSSADLYAQNENDTLVNMESSTHVRQQMRIEGFVYDNDSLSVPFARIEVVQGDKRYYGVSDIDGRFSVVFDQDGSDFVYLKCRNIMYKTVIIEQIPTANGQAILEVFMEEDDAVELYVVGVLIYDSVQQDIKPPKDPYQFGTTKINQDDLRHRP